jgi:hypothetical protein
MITNYPALYTELSKPEYAGLSSEAALLLLLDARFPNPEPAQEVARPIRKNEVLGLLAPASMVALLSYTNLALVFESFDKGDRPSCVAWAYALRAANVLTTDADVAAVVGYVGSTVPDPVYKPLLTWPELTGESSLAELDIAVARLQPKAEAVMQQRTALLSQLSALDFLSMQLSQGVDVELPE